jgi:hypothetical protein
MGPLRSGNSARARLSTPAGANVSVSEYKGNLRRFAPRWIAGKLGAGEKFVEFEGKNAPHVRGRRRTERGEGKLKAIVFTIIFVAGVVAAFKILPPYVAEYQLKDKMQETARFAVVNRDTEEIIKDKVYKVIVDLDIPAKREDIKVMTSLKAVGISVSYSVPVDLYIYQTDLHFNPATENASLM